MKFPEHKCALHLEHNHNRNYYETIEEFINDNRNFYKWESEEHKKRSIDTNEIWTLQWYPETPNGFHAIAAPTLEELLEFANKEE